MTDAIDPMALARFMVLPGASRLVEAFSAIPDSGLRESTIAHAEAIAMAFASAPVHSRAPDPLHVVKPDPVKALSGPRRGEAHSEDPQVRAAQLMLQGVPPAEVARQLAMDVTEVLAAKKKGKTAGLKFPPVKMGRYTEQPPAPPPKHGFITTMEGLQALGGKGMGAMTKAATQRGISIPQYMARRALALSMALEGRPLQEIATATKEPRLILQQWWTMARNAGHNVPYMTWEPPHVEQEVVPEAENVVELRPADGGTRAFPLYIHEIEGKGSGALRRIAKEMDLSIEEFMTKRRAAVELFKTGETSWVTADKLGLTRKQAQNWRARAIGAGLITQQQINAARAENRAKRAAG